VSSWHEQKGSRIEALLQSRFWGISSKSDIPWGREWLALPLNKIKKFDFYSLKCLSLFNKKKSTVRPRIWQLVCATEKSCQNPTMTEKLLKTQKLILRINCLFKYDIFIFISD
jgi:hypothetical protein